MDEREFLKAFVEYLQSNGLLDDDEDVQDNIRMFLEYHLSQYKQHTFELRDPIPE